MIFLFLFLLVVGFNIYYFLPFTREAYLDSLMFRDKKGGYMVYSYNLFGIVCLILYFIYL